MRVFKDEFLDLLYVAIRQLSVRSQKLIQGIENKTKIKCPCFMKHGHYCTFTFFILDIIPRAFLLNAFLYFASCWLDAS